MIRLTFAKLTAASLTSLGAALFAAAGAAGVEIDDVPRLSAAQRRAVVTIVDGNENSAGTGFVVAVERGQVSILTAQHCVEGGALEVEFAGGDAYPATLVSVDHEWDLALLRVVGRFRVAPLELLSRDAPLTRGDVVVAVGRAPDGGLREHEGTYRRRERVHSPSGGYPEFAAMSALVPRGFSGGPIVTFDGPSGRVKVAAVTSCGSDTDVYGAPPLEIHRFLTTPARDQATSRSIPAVRSLAPRSDRPGSISFTELFPNDAP